MGHFSPVSYKQVEQGWDGRETREESLRSIALPPNIVGEMYAEQVSSHKEYGIGRFLDST